MKSFFSTGRLDSNYYLFKELIGQIAIYLTLMGHWSLYTAIRRINTKKWCSKSVNNKTIDARLESINAVSNIIHIDPELASEAARCYMELTNKARKSKLNSPSLFDAIVLASGKLLKAKVLTSDEHFKNLSETVW